MQLSNSKYIYAGLLNGLVQLFSKVYPDIKFDECWEKLSDKSPWLFTEEIKAVCDGDLFKRIVLFNSCSYKEGEYGLKSIFSGLLSENGNKAENINYYFKPAVFQLDNTIFPLENKNKYQELLQKMWSEFNEELQTLKSESFSDHEKLTALYELLKKYSSYISSTYSDEVNVFENAKLNAALSHCISLSENKELPYLLVSGDISGIQSFIYNISSKRAMVSLKGRSFYVQLLAETIAAELTDACGMTLTHQVYAAGGKFYMLCPNTTLVNESINKYKKSIQEWVWEKFKGKISLQIESLAFDLKMQEKQLFAETFTDSNLPLGHLWKNLSDKISESKKRKFEHLLINRFEEFFNSSGQGGKMPVCAVSNEELNPNNSVVITKDSEDQQELIVSKEVNEQIKIGKKLFSAKFLVDVGMPTHDSFQIGLNTHWELMTQLPSKAVRCIAINQQMVVPVIKADMVIESRLFGGIPMAGTKDNPATLEDLCKNEDRIENLGVLRMDVDNLGSLFMKGFGTNAGFSLMATLSAALETYFSGYLNTIRGQEKYNQFVNIVYAGGDDVFAVGRWDKLIEFAIEVKAGFKKMVCNREDISISGGIAITGAKFPISKAAELAAEAEDLAKDFKINNKQKNALTLFGIPVSFETEMPFVIEFKNDLKEWLGKKQISKGLLFKLFEYYQLYLDGKPDWQWQSAYTIARYEETCAKDQKAIYTSLKELLFTKMYKNKFHNVRFEAIIVACRWAELLTKNHKSNA